MLVFTYVLILLYPKFNVCDSILLNRQGTTAYQEVTNTTAVLNRLFR